MLWVPSQCKCDPDLETPLLKKNPIIYHYSYCDTEAHQLPQVILTVGMHNMLQANVPTVHTGTSGHTHAHINTMVRGCADTHLLLCLSVTGEISKLRNLLLKSGKKCFYFKPRLQWPMHTGSGLLTPGQPVLYRHIIQSRLDSSTSS